MSRSIEDEGYRGAELHGRGMLVVEAMEGPGCCCPWLFVVQPAQPTQLASSAERRLVGCRRPTAKTNRTKTATSGFHSRSS
jgi:hypothetical protein